MVDAEQCRALAVLPPQATRACPGCACDGEGVGGGGVNAVAHKEGGDPVCRSRDRIGTSLKRWQEPPSPRARRARLAKAACVIRAVVRGRIMKRSKFSEAQIAFILRQIAKGGECMRSGSTGCTARWACNCGTRRRSARSRQSCARIGNWPHDRTRPGQWTSFMISLPLGASCECLRSLTRSRASRRRSNLGSTSAALMLWRYSKKSAGKSDSRKQSGSIKAQSLSLGLSARCHARLLSTGQAH